MDLFKDQKIRSFSFTLNTPDSEIISRCKIMGLSDKEANLLIDIKNELKEEENKIAVDY